MQPTVSFHAVTKCGGLLAPFYYFYFPIHQLDVADFFRFFPILVYTESAIYQMDEENEIGLKGESEEHCEILCDILRKQGLFDEKIEEEFSRGMEYYEMESAMRSGMSFTDEDVVRASRSKCFDVRVLHRLLFRMLEKPYDEDLLETLWVLEALADAEDDIRQYKIDVERNVFNAYHLFVKLYGKDGKKRIREHTTSLEQEYLTTIAEYPSETQQQYAKLWEGYRAIVPRPEIPEPILSCGRFSDLAWLFRDDSVEPSRR